MWQTGRFIPACAGNRDHSRSRPLQTAVHPRVCGEQRVPVDHWLSATGSSPRVRGTALGASDIKLIVRFIPACAGNRARSRSCLRSGAVHPRVCGEQAADQVMKPGACGSSPRVRGTGSRPDERPDCGRFIPACAGNRVKQGAPSSVASVHPRVCGEQRMIVRTPALMHGSSPRVRGTASEITGYYDDLRFIPACAGNSAQS